MRIQNVLLSVASAVLPLALATTSLFALPARAADAPLAAASDAASSAAAIDGDALISRGKYLAVAADCAACHTAGGGRPFAGGLDIETPIGHIVSTNITPSRSAGIGAYTLAQFSAAIRRGIRADGANLYPAMPYTAYAKLTDDDVAALYAYFSKGVEAVDAAPARQTALPFPFDIRRSMAAWNLLFLDSTSYRPVAGKSVEWNRGAYLAQALGHCQTCHTPRNFLMAERDSQALSGASLGAWFAPNITSDKATGIGSWTEDDVFTYLKTGHSSRISQAGGPMLEAIDKSFSKLDDSDLHAIAAWVTTVPPIKSGSIDKTTLTPAPIANDLREIDGSADKGALIYSDSCASCHQASGKGVRHLPPLVGNAAFSRPVPDNAIMAILHGLTPEHGQDMPGFADKLNDAQIADLTNFLFRQFGASDVQTTAAHVAALRAGGPTSPLLLLSRIGMAVGALIVLALGIAIGVRRKRVR
ncbi:cytochrome c [Robbsia sp. KACC 23696]|uniref:cytochrome c n=1 Tax=Robbsia sp. KACC 23696 TaxID=3149231 RepID=UPI00325B58BC